ncbi:unnamed protein product [Heterosigma akashiwo]
MWNTFFSIIILTTTSHVLLIPSTNQTLHLPRSGRPHSVDRVGLRVAHVKPEPLTVRPPQRPVHVGQLGVGRVQVVVQLPVGGVARPRAQQVREGLQVPRPVPVALVVL